jgi:large subunit ribosomal protein L10e
MGKNKRFEVELELVADYDVQVRDNAIEAARMAANKHLEKALEHNYFLRVAKYPHHILREHAALGVAGSDRISKGMKGAFGKPKGRMALVNKGTALFRVRCEETAIKTAKEALKRANLKIPGKFEITVRDIRKDPLNLERPLDIEAIEDVPEETPAIEEEEAAEETEGAEKKEEAEGGEEKKEEKAEEKKE